MLYRARWIIPITSEPLENGEVLVRGDRIAGVGAGLAAAHPDEPVMDLGDAAILPGFINAHSHLDYTIARGRVNDLPLWQWVPALGRYADLMTSEDFYWSSMLGLAEGIASGFTTFADASYSGEPVKAMTEVGVGGISYREVFAFRPYHDLGEQFSLLERHVDEMRGQAGTNVFIGISPHSPYLARPELLRRVKALADRENLPVSVHVSESREELSFVRDFSGPYAEMANAAGWSPEGSWRSPFDYLASFGLLGPRTQCVHCVYIDEQDIDLIIKTGSPVAHCPKSNAKLGRGIAPVVGMLKAGITVGLGTDSTASNNILSPFEEMRFAADMQRAAREDPEAVTAKQALELATIIGAKSLGMDQEVGSIEAGKRADLTAVRLSSLTFQPDSDPTAGIVFSASASDVILTTAAGRELYRSGKHTSLDVEEVVSWTKKSLSRLSQALAADSRA